MSIDDKFDGLTSKDFDFQTGKWKRGRNMDNFDFQTGRYKESWRGKSINEITPAEARDMLNKFCFDDNNREALEKLARQW